MKRFYETAEVAAGDGGFAVTLDGRTVNTPQRAPLRLPSAALAEAVAAEWRAQVERIDSHAMPLTRIANTAIDRVAARRPELVAEVAGYCAADLLCYRAAAPPELVQRQHETWQPLLDWAACRHGARLRVTTGVTPVDQPPDALRAVAAALARFDDFALAALHSATAASGSVVIALALAEGRIDAAAAWQAAGLDESWQAERWGADHEASLRRDGLRAAITAAGEFLALCRKPG